MKNLYPGVNPYLNSRLQSPGGGWLSFHNSMIERLADHLHEVLPPGYLASTLTDYIQPPARFETYSEADRACIIRRMAEIASQTQP